METVEEGFRSLFYGATILALAFFVHKVLWLVQYRRLQGALVKDAVARLRDGNAAALAAWEDFATSCWANALGQADVKDATTFVRRVEEGLGRLRTELKAPRRSLEEQLGEALAGGDPPGPARATVLSAQRLTGKAIEPRIEVTMELRFPRVAAPRPPDKRLYELKVASRYSVLRRALVFFSGAADVVYSSQHVALMSQNVHLPISVVIRRLSLVFLILAVVAVDLVFGAQAWIRATLTAWMTEPPAVNTAAKAANEGSFVTDHLPSILAFGLWMAAYGLLYLALYFLIRRRYQVSVRRLREMLADEGARMRSIHRTHQGELIRWGRAYGRSLDNAVEITLRHAETLIDHQGYRLRRRVAGAPLFEGAKAIADSLFLRLPESRGEVQDVATLQKHSFKHNLWPRPDEMSYQVRFAEYRAAWQHLELAVGDLRKEHPDPAEAHDLWRSAITYATVFSPLVPSGTADTLRQAYAQMVTECVSETDRDLSELDRRLGELEHNLDDQLACARGLVLSKVELANQQVQGAVAALASEIINVREQARLEAMAFEI